MGLRAVNRTAAPGWLATAVAWLWLVGCAEPRAPTGGPRDTTPPALLFSEPVNETVNYRGNAIWLEFSEYVNEGSFARAYSITPTPPDPPSFRWRKRRVEIRYGAPFRDSTTYVIVLDNNLRDMRSVALTRPIVLAFSTGDIIDQGRIRGRVVEPFQGTPVAGYDVLAYMLNADTTAAIPSYRTQTDKDGSFAFSNIREQAYFVAAVQDRNRNVQPDPNEPFATSPVPRLRASPDTTHERYDWVIGRLDTIAPTVDRIRALSSRRLQVRFSESVAITQDQPVAWELRDSLTREQMPVLTWYQTQGDTRSVYLRTGLLEERAYELRTDDTIADSSGNAAAAASHYFTAPSRADTFTLRFTGFVPSDSADAVALSSYMDGRITFSEALYDRLFSDLVSAKDTLGNMRALRGRTRDGTAHTFTFIPPLGPGERVHVSVRDPSGRDTVYTQTFGRIAGREAGSLSGNALPRDAQMVIELLGPNRQILLSTTPDSSGAFSFHDLPQGSYPIRAYIDVNENGQWDGGQIRPYVAPEPMTWLQTPESVRPRWNTELPDTLRVPVR